MLYSDDFPSSFEEMLSWYPQYYQDVEEMTAILQTQGRLADELMEHIDRGLCNAFIDEADEATITRMEAFLKISLNGQKTLDNRRRFLKSHFSGMGKVSASSICEMIQSYTNAPVEVELVPFDSAGNQYLEVNIYNSNSSVYTDDISSMLQSKLPAHIQCICNIVPHTTKAIGFIGCGLTVSNHVVIC